MSEKCKNRSCDFKKAKSSILWGDIDLSDYCGKECYVDHLRTQLTEAMSMLNNVWYWEECPQDYKDRIEQLKEQGE
jgi:hypothetical protein